MTSDSVTEKKKTCSDKYELINGHGRQQLFKKGGILR